MQDKVFHLFAPYFPIAKEQWRAVIHRILLRYNATQREKEGIVRGIANEMVLAEMPVGQGGVFCSLLRFTAPSGYDILVPREVRLDAFLFGEEPGRYIVALPESRDDAFLLKMDEARLNCCFLGRSTKNRVVVDGFDFGPVSRYVG